MKHGFTERILTAEEEAEEPLGEVEPIGRIHEKIKRSPFEWLLSFPFFAIVFLPLFAGLIAAILITDDADSIPLLFCVVWLVYAGSCVAFGTVYYSGITDFVGERGFLRRHRSKESYVFWDEAEITVFCTPAGPEMVRYLKIYIRKGDQQKFVLRESAREWQHGKLTQLIFDLQVKQIGEKALRTVKKGLPFQLGDCTLTNKHLDNWLDVFPWDEVEAIRLETNMEAHIKFEGDWEPVADAHDTPNLGVLVYVAENIIAQVHPEDYGAEIH